MPLNAQSLRDSGYIVLQNGDTLYGEVQRLKETFSGVEFYNKIRFWDESGARKKYAYSSLIGYRIGNEVFRSFRLEAVPGLNILQNYYRLVPYGGEETFLKVIKEGPLCIYEYEWIDGMDDFISTFPLLRRESEDLAVRATQGIFGLKRNVLINYFSDCPDLQSKLKEGDFSHVYEVVNYYNTQCIR